MSIKPTKELNAAQESARQAKNELAKAELDVIIAELAGNPALFIPIADLSKYGKNLSKEDQKLLPIISQKLEGKRFFLGEMVFEPKKNASKELGITDAETAVLSQMMDQHGFNFGNIPSYNLQQDIKEVRRKDKYVGKSGTGVRDAVRAHLLNHFNSDIFSKFITLEGIQQPDQTGQLTTKFNVSAELSEEMLAAGLSNEDIAETIDYTFNRAVVREYTRGAESRTPTDIALKKYRCEKPISVDYDGAVIKVSISLSQTVKGAFRDDHITPKSLESIFTQEINMGVQLALLQKQETSPLEEDINQPLIQRVKSALVMRIQNVWSPR